MRKTDTFNSVVSSVVCLFVLSYLRVNKRVYSAIHISSPPWNFLLYFRSD